MRGKKQGKKADGSDWIQHGTIRTTTFHTGAPNRILSEFLNAKMPRAPPQPKRAWTEQEEYQLVEGHVLLGPKWVSIARRFNDFSAQITDAECKNHYYSGATPLHAARHLDAWSQVVIE